MVVKWLDEPEAHDYDAATEYLSLLAEPENIDKTVAALRTAGPVYRKAKDILRAARLALLPESNVHVAILLVRADAARPMEIADGYHRVCASYLTDENTPIPCCLASWQP